MRNKMIMEALENIIQKISSALSEIESHFPELQAFLDEQPMTLGNSPGDTMEEADLQSYLNSLEQLLQQYKKTHSHSA
ncbi:hypothetical protein [Croceiramulus getboli]|nr:hypothetical protein P8624_09520 [Flavobacteriaceae bacterium YJPT1-3]